MICPAAPEIGQTLPPRPFRACGENQGGVIMHTIHVSYWFPETIPLSASFNNGRPSRYLLTFFVEQD